MVSRALRVPGTTTHLCSQRGFTLVELLIVVLIIGALAAVAIPRIGASASRAKANACKANIDLQNERVELFKVETGAYPDKGKLKDVDGFDVYFPDGLPIIIRRPNAGEAGPVVQGRMAGPHVVPGMAPVLVPAARKAHPPALGEGVLDESVRILTEAGWIPGDRQPPGIV